MPRPRDPSRRVSGHVPRVRVGVVNYNGGEMTLRCLRALQETKWAEDLLELVLVDNASDDGVADIVRNAMPRVHVVSNARNVGFSGGANVVMRDVRGIDYVALVNNDAVPEPTWLTALVETLEADPDAGAACPKILFFPRFVSLRIEAAAEIAAGDTRMLGARITGVTVAGRDAWAHTQFAGGCDAVATRGSGTDRAVWTSHVGEVRIPVEPDVGLPAVAAIELAADREKPVRLIAGESVIEVVVGTEPRWFEVPLVGPTYDVVNNVGSRLVEGGWGADRGFLERDCGQFDDAEEVFGWCGGAVLLSARYLRDVGVFDDRFFLYYEDTDLAWRGRIRGWRYRYVPESVVRHEHAASTGEGSALFVHYVERNRFTTVFRNAPWSMVREALLIYAIDTAVITRRDVVRPLLSGRPSDPALVLARLRAFGAFVRLLPSTLVSRLRQRSGEAARRAIVERWATPR